MTYHTRFTRFQPETVKRTRHLMRGWSTLTDEERWVRMQLWNIHVGNSLGMAVPKLRRNPNAEDGYYLTDANEIHMAKPSIITLLHEFRHAMQTQMKAGRWFNAEHDARGWSLSLYHLIAPRTLKRLAAEGKVLHVTAADFE